jgi:hypothetical protein
MPTAIAGRRDSLELPLPQLVYHNERKWTHSPTADSDCGTWVYELCVCVCVIRVLWKQTRRKKSPQIQIPITIINECMWIEKEDECMSMWIFYIERAKAGAAIQAVSFPAALVTRSGG